MQSVSSRIWTRVAVSISYDDNNYTTGTKHFDRRSSLYEGIYNNFSTVLYPEGNQTQPLL